ncbi:hypothetical protein LINGRAHAP2_LOCUS35613 [Linum grandiflorum]
MVGNRRRKTRRRTRNDFSEKEGKIRFENQFIDSSCC